MVDQYSRIKLIYGEGAIENLHTKSVCVFGIGGVGGHVVDALIRSGIKKITLVDNDKVSLTNLNRQLIANHETLGKDKCDVMKEHILKIVPDAEVEVYKTFALPENLETFDLKRFDYVVDAIDTIATKVALAVLLENLNVKLISAMGAGNKVDPTKFEVSDIYKTSMCPLAKVMRYELKKRGVKHLKVVYSKEKPLNPRKDVILEENTSKRSIPGSTAFTPSVCGLIIASEVINDLLNFKRE